MGSAWIAAGLGTLIYIVLTGISCSFVFICRMKDKPLGLSACIIAGLCMWFIWFMTYISQIYPYGNPEYKAYKE